MKSEKMGTSHTQQIKQLKRIEGQVRGVTKMIEDRRYCLDIITQIKAVRASLATIEKKIINQHLNHCVHEAVQSKNPKLTDEMLEEIKELIQSARFS
ncbi:MAG: metal-sensitive transcriptional regulator [Bdellovibrionales bacterium]|nr:metal-sensitive transcriptional regulator [Bdellovibrionales bacterium]